MAGIMGTLLKVGPSSTILGRLVSLLLLLLIVAGKGKGCYMRDGMVAGWFGLRWGSVGTTVLLLVWLFGSCFVLCANDRLAPQPACCFDSCGSQHLWSSPRLRSPFRWTEHPGSNGTRTFNPKSEHSGAGGFGGSEASHGTSISSNTFLQRRIGGPLHTAISGTALNNLADRGAIRTETEVTFGFCAGLGRNSCA